MLPTYPANLRHDRVEWVGDAPPAASRDEPLRVHITLLEPAPPAVGNRGERMAAALEKLAAGSALGGVANPMEWEREQREERDLPGRGD